MNATKPIYIRQVLARCPACQSTRLKSNHVETHRTEQRSSIVGASTAIKRFVS